jgi:hypothetical protein
MSHYIWAQYFNILHLLFFLWGYLLPFYFQQNWFSLDRSSQTLYNVFLKYPSIWLVNEKGKIFVWVGRHYRWRYHPTSAPGLPAHGFSLVLGRHYSASPIAGSTGARPDPISSPSLPLPGAWSVVPSTELVLPGWPNSWPKITFPRTVCCSEPRSAGSTAAQANTTDPCADLASLLPNG